MSGTRVRSRLRAAVTCVLAASALLLGAGGTANAAPTASGGGVHASAVSGVILRTQFETVSRGCLDDSNTYHLRVVVCNDTKYQKWTFTEKYQHTWEIRNQATGRCLDHSDAYGLRTFGCNGYDYQRWVYPNGPGAFGDFYIQNVVSKECMDYSPSHGLRVILCNGTSYQDWTNLGSHVPEYPAP